MSSAPTSPSGSARPPLGVPAPEQIRRWRRYLAEERDEARIYLRLSQMRSGQEAQILFQLAKAEARHEKYWLTLLGEHAYPAPRTPLRTRLLHRLALAFGSVFVLALMQNSEERTAYDLDVDATDAMAADEHLHGEVVRALASQSRSKISGLARAMIFGMNDGLVSNLALVVGVGAGAGTNSAVLLAGMTGLVAGALSMAAGEFVSVSSQVELLESARPDPVLKVRLSHLNDQANELTLLFMARGEDEASAQRHAREIILDTTAEAGPPSASCPPGDPCLPSAATGAGNTPGTGEAATGHASEGGASKAEAGQNGAQRVFSSPVESDLAAIGSPWQAAGGSFISFALGAIIPVIPFLLGLPSRWAIGVAVAMVALTLLFTGGMVGVLSGKPAASRAFRQVFIGLGAAGITYAIGALAGVALS